MENKINKYGLLNSLLSIINNLDESDSKVVIAKYLLSNFDTIENINIFDAADECFVTRASIRRFCQYIGFENFRDLKSEKPSYNYYKLETDTKPYPDFLASQISEMVVECNKNLLPQLEHMVERMIESDEIVFLISDIYTSRCLEFQKEMILSGKMVRIVSHHFDDNRILMEMKEKTLLVVISITGGFVKKMKSFIQPLHAKKILMTSISDQEILEEFHYVLTIGNPYLPPSKTIYHTFAVEYYLDILSHEHRQRIMK